jgi:hypothetical protein
VPSSACVHSNVQQCAAAPALFYTVHASADIFAILLPLLLLLQPPCSALQQPRCVHLQQTLLLHRRQHQHLHRRPWPSSTVAAAAAADAAGNQGPLAADISSTEQQQQQQQGSKHGSHQPRQQKAVPIRIAATTDEETYSLEDTKV